MECDTLSTMKRCGNCGSDISHRAPQARFCEDAECHQQRQLAHGRATYGRHRADIRERQNAAHRARVAARPKKVRFCPHCGKDIGKRRKWCDLRCRDKARHAANPTRARAKAARRRGAPGHGISGDAWRRLIRRQRSLCFYCSALTVKLTQDHVVPLNRGGADSEGNIVACCLSCNCSKGDLFLVEWRPRQQLKQSRS
jgi:5-methylcytosine-specific restriction endonuclease McrA